MIALLAAGLFLLQMQQTLKEELRWARQAEATINRTATAGKNGPLPVEEALPIPDGAQQERTELQRIRIPALGLDYRLQAERSSGALNDKREAVTGSWQINLPVDVYGDGVCRLDRLQPGDNIYLETVHRTQIYEVYGSGPNKDEEASEDSVLIVISGYPCGNKGTRVLVAATSTSH